MKKRILLFSALAVIFFWWVGVFLADAALSRATQAAWPLGLGSVEDVPNRTPPPVTTDEAEALADAASTFGVSLQERYAPALQLGRTLTTFVEKPVDPPPAAVTSFLASNQKALDDVRRNLNAGGPRMSWEKLPNLLGHVILARALAADAIVRRDAVAWDDVHAMLNLTRPLARRPEIVSSLTALSIAGLTNRIAQRLPPPAPAWVGEIRTADFRRPMIAAQQAELWKMRRDADSLDLASPYTRLCLANMILLYRAAAFDLAAGRTPTVRPPRWNYVARIGFPDFRRIAKRLDKFDAERHPERSEGSQTTRNAF